MEDRHELTPAQKREERIVRAQESQLAREFNAGSTDGATLDAFTAHVQKLYSDTRHEHRADEVMRRFNRDHHAEIDRKFGHVRIGGVDQDGHVLTTALDSHNRPSDAAGIQVRDSKGQLLSTQDTQHAEEHGGLKFSVGPDGRVRYKLGEGERLDRNKVDSIISSYYGKDGEVPTDNQMYKIRQGATYDPSNRTLTLPPVYGDIARTDSTAPVAAAPGFHGTDKIDGHDQLETIKRGRSPVQLPDGSSIVSKTETKYAGGKFQSEDIQYGLDQDIKDGHLPTFTIKKADGQEQTFEKVLEATRAWNGHGFDDSIKTFSGEQFSYHTNKKDANPQFDPPALDYHNTAGGLFQSVPRLAMGARPSEARRVGSEWTSQTTTDMSGRTQDTLRDDQQMLRRQTTKIPDGQGESWTIKDAQGRRIPLNNISQVDTIWNEARNGYDFIVTADGKDVKFAADRYGKNPELVAPPAKPEVGKAPVYDPRDRLSNGLHQPGMGAADETITAVNQIDRHYGWRDLTSTATGTDFGSAGYKALVTTDLDEQGRVAFRSATYKLDKPNWQGLHNVDQITTTRTDDGYTVIVDAEGNRLIPNSGGSWTVQLDKLGNVKRDTWKSLEIR